MRRRLVEPAGSPAHNRGAVSHRSRGPCSRLWRAFQLTSDPPKSTVEPKERRPSGRCRLKG